jgi:hypothetical protein
VLDALERPSRALPVKMIQIKDDTFTTNRKRVLELCRGIRERGLKFCGAATRASTSSATSCCARCASPGASG